MRIHAVNPWNVATLAAVVIATLGGLSEARELDGVQFVDDLEQSLQRRPAAARLSTAPRYAIPQPPRANYPTRNPAISTGQPGRTTATSAEKPKSWRFGFKNPLSGLMGGKAKEQPPTITRRSSAPQGFQNPVYQASGIGGTTPRHLANRQPNQAMRSRASGNQPRGMFSFGQKDATPATEQLARQQSENSAWTERLKLPVRRERMGNPTSIDEARKSLAGEPGNAPTFQPEAAAPPRRIASNLASPSGLAALPQQETSQDSRADVVQPASFLESAPREILNQHVALADRAPSVRPASAMRPLRKPPLPLGESPAVEAPRAAMPKNPVAALPMTPTPLPEEKREIEPSKKAIALLSHANRLSQTAATEGEYSEVIQTCRQVQAIDSAPTAIEYSKQLASWALNRRGEVKADEGRAKEALLDYEDALRLDPKRWRAIHNRGVLAAQAGRFADAFDDFNHTIRLNPNFAKAYSNRGTLYVQAGKLEKALVDFRLAIANDPDLAVAHKGRGRVCHMLGDFDTALQHFDAAMLLAPGDARIVNSRGDLLTDMGRYRAAASNYRRAIDLDPQLATAYRNLAWLQATCPDKGCRDHELALANANHAITLAAKPNDLDYDTLAAAQAAAGDFEAAAETMDQALALAAESDKGNYEWRQGLYKKGQPYITEPATSIQQASYAE